MASTVFSWNILVVFETIRLSVCVAIEPVNSQIYEVTGLSIEQIHRLESRSVFSHSVLVRFKPWPYNSIITPIDDCVENCLTRKPSIKLLTFICSSRKFYVHALHMQDAKCVSRSRKFFKFRCRIPCWRFNQNSAKHCNFLMASQNLFYDDGQIDTSWKIESCCSLLLYLSQT